jgi:hypothetical protein
VRSLSSARLHGAGCAGDSVVVRGNRSAVSTGLGRDLRKCFGPTVALLDKRFDLFDNRLRFLQGEYTDTLPGAPIKSIALLRLGDDLDDSCGDILDALYDRISTGGFVVVEDFLSPAARKSIEEFRAARGIGDPIDQVDWSGVAWRKTDEPTRRRAKGKPKGHAPLASAAPTPAKDLTVVVVFYNMKREAQRTLHALSRAYQEGIDELDYEVLVVENGSSAEQRLGSEFVESFGPEFRYIDMAEAAVPSPIPALNRGVGESRGEAMALMIDGAHVVTPGVLRYGMLGLRSYAPSIVATQQWFVGPGQQGEVIVDGYDRDYEDRLFETSFPVPQPPHVRHIWPQTKMGRPPRSGECMQITGHFSGVPEGRRRMGCEWMTQDGLAQAIAPVYTEYIGRQLAQVVTV